MKTKEHTKTCIKSTDYDAAIKYFDREITKQALSPIRHKI